MKQPISVQILPKLLAPQVAAHISLFDSEKFDPKH
jgi:hypothetical protein